MLFFLRLLFIPFALLFVLITEFRNFLFNIRLLRSSKFDIPTIGIGNLSVGGTGKSPHTEYLITHLKNRYKIATLSRGYGRKTKGFLEVSAENKSVDCGDEPLQFKLKNKEIVVAVDENRVRGVMNLVHDHSDLEVILLDDVFQHRAIKPGLLILLTEYDSPFFKDFILPVGNLRELRKNASRADLIVVTKCPEEIAPEMKIHFENSLKRYCNKPIFYSKMQYGNCYSIFDQHTMITDLKNKKIIALSGIANPQPFHNYLKTKTEQFHSIVFNDHHKFNAKDIERIERDFNSFAAEETIIITTEKDAMRLISLDDSLQTRLKKLPIYSLPITIQFNTPDLFNSIIDEFISENRRDYIEN